MRVHPMQPAYCDSSDESDEGGQAAPRDPPEVGLNAGFLGGAWEPYASSGVRALQLHGIPSKVSCSQAWRCCYYSLCFCFPCMTISMLLCWENLAYLLEAYMMGHSSA